MSTRRTRVRTAGKKKGNVVVSPSVRRRRASRSAEAPKVVLSPRQKRISNGSPRSRKRISTKSRAPKVVLSPRQKRIQRTEKKKSSSPRRVRSKSPRSPRSRSTKSRAPKVVLSPRQKRIESSSPTIKRKHSKQSHGKINVPIRTPKKEFTIPYVKGKKRTKSGYVKVSPRRVRRSPKRISF